VALSLTSRIEHEINISRIEKENYVKNQSAKQIAV
jgi:hypothetical protein